MYYYIEDQPTMAVLFIHTDPYIINNLNAGVLDCEIKTFYSDSQQVKDIYSYVQSGSRKTGIRVVGNTLQEIDLTLYPDVRHKRSLLLMRSVAFEVLMEESHRYRAINLFGFTPQDSFIVSEALKSQNRIDEYAQLLKIDPESAKQELSMLAESAHIDEFRIFSACTFWAQKINKCESVSDISKYKPVIKESFHNPVFIYD